ncbi:hypothetical protein TV39_04510 [Arthrobacter sp. SPG23]|uniref:hypothetical protein n=1 Tax=Arthrobacter sp. SPG23 TaxID=1610703 RepID=UPI0005B7D2F0|nr:hypothetical protein TV39_04510 [Arthrobacter sp. SPG23]
MLPWSERAYELELDISWDAATNVGVSVGRSSDGSRHTNVRMGSCQRTKDYVTKRTAEGKSKRDIMSCLKHYAAREIYRQITNPQAAPDNSDLRQTRITLGCTIARVARELGQ